MTPLQILQAERAKYPTPMTPAQLGTFLNDAAYKMGGGYGLLLKPSGNNCPCRGTAISCDIIFDRTTGIHYDVLTDSEGVAKPKWDNVGPMDLARWLAPTKPADMPEPPVPPPPPPPEPPPPSSGVEALLAQILAEMQRPKRIALKALGVEATGTIE